MELIFAYGAGLLTLVNPCILPILPIVLAAALQSGRTAPLYLCLGLSVSFVSLGLAVAAAGRAFGISEETVSAAGAALMVVFGLILLLPALSGRFATATSGIAASADLRISRLDNGTQGTQFLTGLLLGAVWSPCIGPTLGAAIGLASQGQGLVRAGVIMTGFAFGVSTIILALSYGAHSVILRRRAMLRGLAERSRPIMGIVFAAMGVAILLGLPKYAEAWALDRLPPWLIDLSVAL